MTQYSPFATNSTGILIHTSVKLVTVGRYSSLYDDCDFNPHEREARDDNMVLSLEEARDFNPHEREARDISAYGGDHSRAILIHTSVKLVTEKVAQ